MKVLLLALEEHRRDIIRRLRSSKQADFAGRVKVVFGPLPFNAALLEEMTSFIAREQISLVIVDTIHAWWGLSDENDAAEVLRKGFPLLRAIRLTEAAWLGLVHTRKSGGEHGHEIRGSSAILGLVDIAISMKRTEAGGNRRILEAVSRYDETPAKLIVEYGDHGYQSLGDPDMLSSKQKDEKLWAALTGVGQTIEQLTQATQLSKQDVSRSLARLGDRISRNGMGHKGDPYCYQRHLICPTSNSGGGTLDESNLSVERTT